MRRCQAHEASRNGDLAGIRRARRLGADLEARCWDGDALSPAICWAARAGQVEAVSELIALGASVDGANEWGGTALHYAAQLGNGSLLRLLIEHGASTDVQAEGCTPLMAAAQFGQVEAVRVLLGHGAAVNVRDRGGHTALYWARELATGQMSTWLPDEVAASAERMAAIGSVVIELLERAGATD